jgi:predicted sulfurtransferase
MTQQVVTHITAVEGWKHIQKEPHVIFIDVRSEMEFFVYWSSSWRS